MFLERLAQNVLNRNHFFQKQIYTNAGKAQLLGSELGLTYSPIKNLKLFLGGNTYYLKMNGNLFNNTVSVANGGWVYSINTNLNFPS